MENKITYASVITDAIEVLTANGFYAEGIEKLIALRSTIEKRNASKASGERKPTKAQRENEDVKVRICEALESASAMTATEVASTLDISVQKASALLKQMVDVGTIVRTAPKGKEKATFALATAEIAE